ncbi:MAG: hypothetical protein OWT28_09890 [Firmicutes bacterium]|nr:hypothetical protein [Bacillota bacterium]
MPSRRIEVTRVTFGEERTPQELTMAVVPLLLQYLDIRPTSYQISYEEPGPALEQNQPRLNREGM